MGRRAVWGVALVAVLVAGGQAGTAEKPRPLKVCMLSGSVEYKSNESLPLLAAYLEKHYQVDVTLCSRKGKSHELPGLEALDGCDVMLLFTRRMKLQGEQLERFKKYCLSGRPIVGIRTASHGVQTWLALDKEVLGGNYRGHYGRGHKTTVLLKPEALKHPILKGVVPCTSDGSLYKNTGIAKDTELLAEGEIPGHREPIAWTRVYKGARVFYTSLGHPNDFKNKTFLRLIANALFWVSQREPATK